MATSALIQVPQAQSGATLADAYGDVRAAGNELLNTQLPGDNSRVAAYALAEGPWNKIKRLWISGKLVDVTDVNVLHFHPGLDGLLGEGLATSSNGGETDYQRRDGFFNLLPGAGNTPPAYQFLTYSRKVMLWLHVAPDPYAPSPQLTVIGDYETRKVRIFDNVGAQTSFAFSKNPAWQILDLFIRKRIKPEWTVAAAAAAGGDLTASEKALIDWQSFYDAAGWCDAIITGTTKRVECSVAWAQPVSLQNALDQVCKISQLYWIERAGKIQLRADQARASTFTLTADHVVPGTFIASKSQLRGAANRYIAKFNDLNPQKSCTIDTVANNGLVRASGVLTCKCIAAETHPFIVGDNVAIVGDDVTASFIGDIVVTNVIDTRNFQGLQAGADATSGSAGSGFFGTAESRFAQRTKLVDHEAHQLAVGQRGLNLTPTYKRVPITLDFGNNTYERVERILTFIKTRTLGADATPYQAPFQVNVQASMWAVDNNAHALLFQLNGDVITIDRSVSEEFQGDYEIFSMKFTNPAGDTGVSSSSSSSGQSDQAETVELILKQYISTAFSDAANTPQSLNPSLPRRGVPPITVIGTNGHQVLRLYPDGSINPFMVDDERVITPGGKIIDPEKWITSSIRSVSAILQTGSAHITAMDTWVPYGSFQITIPADLHALLISGNEDLTNTGSLQPRKLRLRVVIGASTTTSGEVSGVAGTANPAFNIEYDNPPAGAATVYVELKLITSNPGLPRDYTNSWTVYESKPLTTGNMVRQWSSSTQP